VTRTTPLGLYVHVPFCRAHCAYCDFDTTAGLDHLMPAYAAAVCREIEQAGTEQPRAPGETVYLGGGTPSLLPLAELEAILAAIRDTFPLPAEAEVTLEANPGTVSRSYLAALRDMGFNRLSLGVQSANDEELALLGRIHSWRDAVEAVIAARAAGFANLSLDLIYGLPGQPVERWRRTLEAALDLGPDHLSLYALSVEPGTPLARRVERGELPRPDDDLAAGMFELAEEVLATAGFFHYELSNWARFPEDRTVVGDTPSHWWPADADPARSEDLSPFVGRHNLTYWRNRPYLGFGAGASSWTGWERRTNVRHPQTYIHRIGMGRSPAAEREAIALPLEVGETMMMGLRTAEGVHTTRFEARFGSSPEDIYGDELIELRALGLLDWDGEVARLTARGRLLGNRVFERFLP
jgi:oxygen-independent coproporphyrinogen-3 oxidase